MKDLNVIVVGAGIGGLQTALALAKDGHNVTVLESAKAFEEVCISPTFSCYYPTLYSSAYLLPHSLTSTPPFATTSPQTQRAAIDISQVGAGIRIPPNSLKLSNSWGVDFTKVSRIPSLGNRFLDWKGNILLDVSYHDMETRYGAPYYFLHRADLVKLLAETANGNPRVDVRMNARVAKYDFEAPAVTLESGEVLNADVIVCADGIKSAVRDIINGTPLPPQDTGDVAYRILVPAAPLLADPEMAHLVKNPWAMHWMGPEGHAVGYPLRGGELYNIIIDVTHSSDLGEPLPPDSLETGAQVWKSARSNAELVQRFKDWCPEVRKLCAMTGEYLKWKLADFDQLDHWVHPSGKVALLGDSCHPMMPYMAQGAAQATEDAATLASCLSSLPSIPSALQRYEALRKPRTTYIARNTRVLQEWLHLYDGSAREERDRLMRDDSESNPIYWGWTERKDWLFRYDASQLDGEQGGIPSLPPMPRDENRVYKEMREQLRGESKL